MRGGYDLVLMDCHMPDMDGFAATVEIRRREGVGGRRTPIVALTADALSGDAERCLAAGMDDYLAKPVTAERLAAVVARWSAPSAAEPAGAMAPDPPEDTDPVLDRSVLATLQELERRSQDQLLPRVIRLYLQEVPAQLAALQEAMAQGAAGRVEDLAHGLKGSSAQLGATRMSRLCAALQEAGGRPDLRQAAQMAELQREFGRVRAALEAVLSEAGTG